jgi:hypothetical protein
MKHLLLPVLLCLGAPGVECSPIERSSRDDVSAKVEAVIAEYDAAHAAWYQRYLAAEGSAEVMRSIPETAPYGTRLMVFAAEAPASDGAFQACAWVIANVRSGASMTAAVRLVTEHFLERPGIGELVDSIPAGTEANDELLRRVLENPPSNDVAARACYRLAAALRVRLQTARSPEEAVRIEAQAEAYYTRCQSEAFAGVALDGDLTIGEKARADVFEMKHLRVGQPAPEITGEDLDGVPLRLGDYRGKVVLLDFWGDW